MSKIATAISSFVFFTVFSSLSFAQFNVEWAEFAKNVNGIQDSSGAVLTELTTDPDEKDFAWGDVNQDGWIDLIVVRKQPQTFAGKRRNYLLMNENGILVERSTEYASASDVGGDQGFLTPTNDRDVVLTDVNQDGWLDIVTATTVSDGEPKHISHPRVYINLGAPGGTWLGFKFENSRFPQLLNNSGNPVAPRFCSVSAGDVTGDGYPDLYFADYDTGETGPPESPVNDLNDRLLINNGSGFFTDSTTTRMTSAMLSSAFGMSSDLTDMNGDGLLDVVKATALGTPQYVSVAYNNPANVGFYSLFQNSFHTGFSPYHLDTGDLNNDGKPDVLISDDGSDRYRYNLGNDALNRVNWGTAKTFTFASGSDDGFAGNNLIIDLDNDTWNDVLIADVDVDVAGCSRRMHIYHNPGGAVGSQITLKEEAQQSGTGGWKGVKGMLVGDLTGTFDIAVFDINNDGWNDIVSGRCAGTFVWMNKTAPSITGVTSNTADGAYGIGQNVDVRVSFSKNVVVTGTPTLSLETGANDASASYVSGSGSSTLVFQYTVQAGESSSDLDYVGSSALTLSGGSIQDSAAHNAILILPTPGASGSLGNNKNIVIDGVTPEVLAVSSSTTNGTYGVGALIDLNVIFSEVVTVSGSPSLALETGTTDRVASYVSGSGSNSLLFQYQVQVGDLSGDLDYQSSAALSPSGSVKDGVNNDSSLNLPAPGAVGSLSANADLVIDADGLNAFGIGTPGCNGAHALSAIGYPTVGNAGFKFACNNAPPNSIGTLVIAPNFNEAGYMPYGMNLIFYVNMGLYNRILIQSDANGNCEIPYPISGDPKLVGSSFTVQAIWFWQGSCPQQPVSSSNGLTVNILPQ